MERELALTEIEQRYPDQWVLVEETAWEGLGNPLRGIVRACSMNRGDLSASLQQLHKRSPVHKSASRAVSLSLHKIRDIAR